MVVENTNFTADSISRCNRFGRRAGLRTIDSREHKIIIVIIIISNSMGVC
jgi:hypothetical protein